MNDTGEDQRFDRVWESGGCRPEAAGPPDAEGVVEPAWQLTPREKEVLALLLNGKTLKQIAAGGKVTVQSVWKHQQRIFHKFSVHNGVQLLHAVMQNSQRGGSDLMRSLDGQNGHPAPSDGNPTDGELAASREAALRQQILADARTLDVSLSAETLDAALAYAEQEGLSHLGFLALIFGAPAQRRRQQAARRRETCRSAVSVQ